MEDHGNKGIVLRKQGYMQIMDLNTYGKIRVDEHITLILLFAQRTFINVIHKSGIKGTYDTYEKKLNALGKISKEALTGNT